jgi:hypothetical protein
VHALNCRAKGREGGPLAGGGKPRGQPPVYSATTRPPIARCTSLSAWSTPAGWGAGVIELGLPLPLFPALPFKPLAPSPGCLTPKAAPNILLPGSPILGPFPSSAVWSCKLVVKMAGSLGTSALSPKVELISAFSVGWEGRLGRLGLGSLPAFVVAECSGIETWLKFRWALWWLWAFPEPDAVRAPGRAEMEGARPLWERDGLEWCWDRALTAWMTFWASGPS